MNSFIGWVGGKKKKVKFTTNRVVLMWNFVEN